MVSEFRRWAGYTRLSAPYPTPVVTTTTRGSDSARAADKAAVRQASARTRPTTSANTAEPTASEAAMETTAVASGGREDKERRERARSISSRRSMTRTSADRGRVAKRSKSSGPSRREAGVGRRPGVLAVATVDRAPWGAAPRVGGARARAQAWAKTNLRVGSATPSVGGTGGRTASRAGQPRAASAGTGCNRGRIRVRRGRAGCGSGPHKIVRRRAKGGAEIKTATSRRTTLDAEINPRRDRGRGRVRGRVRGASSAIAPVVERTQPREGPAVDVTRDVLDEESYPELAGRWMGRNCSAAAAGETVEATATLTGSGDAVPDERTDRVVDMLASLEKAVMEVCKVRHV